MSRKLDQRRQGMVTASTIKIVELISLRIGRYLYLLRLLASRVAVSPLVLEVQRQDRDGRRPRYRRASSQAESSRSRLRSVPPAFGVDDLIAEVPEVSLHRFVENLVIANGGLQEGIPIDESFAAIDQLLAKQVVEGCANGGGAAVIEGEAGAIPIATAAHPFELSEDPCFVLIFPLPDPLHERFPAQVVSGFIFLFLESTLDNGLGRNARMVRARYPEGFETLHPSGADENILEGVVEPMP
jgi:hypothetical protein